MNPAVISFYSYKGGAGRTTTAANTIPFLVEEFKAGPNTPILIVDFDLESAGLTYFYDLQDRFLSIGNIDQCRSIHSFKILRDAEFLEKKNRRMMLFGKASSNDLVAISEDSLGILREEANNNGLNVDFLEHIRIDSNINGLLREMLIADKQMATKQKKYSKRFSLRRLCQEIHNSGDNESSIRSILNELLPTCQFIDISHIYNFADGTVFFLGVDDTNQESVALNQGIVAMEFLINACEQYGFCSIIFDSGSGRQSSAHILHQKSDVIVYCMRPTEQFRIGTINNLSFYVEYLARLQKHNKEASQKSIVLLPTAVPRKESLFTKEVFNEINMQIAKTYSEIVDDSFCSYHESLCEVERFKWREAILYKQMLTSEDEKIATEVYRKLAKVVIKNV